MVLVLKNFLKIKLDNKIFNYILSMKNYNKLLKKLSGKYKPNDYSRILTKLENKDNKKESE